LVDKKKAPIPIYPISTASSAFKPSQSRASSVEDAVPSDTELASVALAGNASGAGGVGGEGGVGQVAVAAGLE